MAWLRSRSPIESVAADDATMRGTTAERADAEDVAQQSTVSSRALRKKICLIYFTNWYFYHLCLTAPMSNVCDASA